MGRGGSAALTLLSSALAQPGHLTANIGARATGFGAARHEVIVADLFAAPRTTFAYLRARTAGKDVKFGITQHEIRAGLADLSTIG